MMSHFSLLFEKGMIRYIFFKVNMFSLMESISICVISGWTIDQTDCLENTQALPQRNHHSILRWLLGGKNRLKVERARFLHKRQRRAKPETEPLLPRWGKRGVFLNPKAGAVVRSMNMIPAFLHST
jgi:hypothetical protein